VAILTVDNGSANTCSAAVRRELLGAVRALDEEKGLVAAVLIGAGTHFMTGSDLRELGAAIHQPELPEVIAAIEQCRLPIIAAMHGAALGSGFEVALACDGRICTPNAVVGLPQVSLGVIPGGGATQRLSRLVGRAIAVDMVCSGRQVGADEALALKLVDRIEVASLLDGAIAFAWACAPFKRSVRELAVPVEDGDAFDQAARAALMAGRGRPQVDAALSAIGASTTMPVDAALAHERALFCKLRLSADARALRYQFFARRAGTGGAAAAIRSAMTRSVRKVGVVGGGAMGTQLGRWLLDAGLEVILVERDRRSMRLAAQRFDGPTPRWSIDLAVLADCDVVIEAVSEDYETKVGVFIALDGLLHKDCVLATTTSQLDIDALAAATARPSKVCGMHFIPSAEAASVIEIVRTTHSSEATLATATNLARQIGKLPITAGNAFGFIGQRLLSALQMQCDAMRWSQRGPAGHTSVRRYRPSASMPVRSQWQQ
jgi:3-hydroxyacyl-CoA dehydrogenase